MNRLGPLQGRNQPEVSGDQFQTAGLICDQSCENLAMFKGQEARHTFAENRRFKHVAQQSRFASESTQSCRTETRDGQSADPPVAKFCLATGVAKKRAQRQRAKRDRPPKHVRMRQRRLLQQRVLEGAASSVQWVDFYDDGATVDVLTETGVANSSTRGPNILACTADGRHWRGGK